ncbi:MAG TPA: acyl-CoA dehydrogenase family protein [Nocardioidaceae bacterium]|nr:acyl-CoA dehydrogenase family protein [Nocardioidaceae bacterium]
MDFNLTPEQVDAAALARSILADRVTIDRQKAVEGTGVRHDAELFAELGEAGLVGLALPDECGGAGLTFQELCSVVTEVGRVVAPVPLAWHGPSALALAEFGTPDQKQTWLPRAAAGTVVITSALSEERADIPEQPLTRAVREGDGWVVTGSKALVAGGTVAELFLVPASTDEGVTVFLVQPGDGGVTVEAQAVSDGDQVARLELEGVRLGADRVLAGDDVASWLAAHVTTSLCALQLGITEGALELTSAYAKERTQFGRPIGSFQAVSQRLADGYIDVLGLRLTTWQAVWRLTERLPAELEVATAKLWAADTGHKLAHTTVHVHGGVGIDLDGTAHRYFTTAKRIELMLGGSTTQARAIGRVLAAEPA